MTRTITAGDLEVAYETWGEGDVHVLLLHGFPDDATAWKEVATALPAGFRAIAPHVRGVGSTRFRSPETIRTGQLAAQVRDIVALLDALELDRVIVVGHDWGQRSAQGLAALHPARVAHLISFGDYALTFDRSTRPSLRQVWAFRFHLLANTPIADVALTRWRTRLFRLLWRSWSPHAEWNEEDVRAGRFCVND